MSLREHKQEILTELQDRYASRATVTAADSILIRQEGLITKIPMQRCAEEVFVIQTLRDLGIPTVEIISNQFINTQSGQIDSYTMNEIVGAIDIIHYGDKYLNDKYYNFLGNILRGLRSIKMDGFGSIQLTDSGTKTEFTSDNELLGSVLTRVRTRNYWPAENLDTLEHELSEIKDIPEAVLAHTDILNNVVVDNQGDFYLIDPQTVVSAANQYWDLSYCLIYANGFGCTAGLQEFLHTQRLSENWDLFMTTTKINAYERASFYTWYDSTKSPGMLAFVESLNEGKIRIGTQTFTRKDYE